MEIMRHITHPDEVYALLKFKLAGSKATKSSCNYDSMTKDLKKCYEFLNQTSRSFAAVIQALDSELRDAVCIFYLVLRALDTVEDDMAIPLDKKVPMLKEFHQHLYEPDWCFTDSTEKDKAVLEQFPVISGEFRNLQPNFQKVIADITAKMGEGMTVFIDRAPHSLADWDEYCHYVAGLVGIGLSQLFSESKLEARYVGQDTNLSNSMGLFLQKTNIIRDYLEDVQQQRLFWPKKVWGKYGKELVDLSFPENRDEAIKCLNELVTNALQHIPDVFKYLSRLKNQSVFNFCAIPQVMAIATLERCYNNPQVFEGVVKIRKGEAVKMMLGTNSMESVKAVMKHFCQNMKARVPRKDPSAAQTKSILSSVLTMSRTSEQFVSSTAFLPLYASFAILVGAIVWQYWQNINNVKDRITQDL